MRTIRLIARRDWVSTICSPTGLIIVGLYLVLAGYVFWQSIIITQEATLRYTFASLANITVLVVPLITMRLFSEELRSGTFEVLTSHPVTDIEIVLGKFLAGYMAFLTMTLPTFAYVVILEAIGSPDWGPALCVYLGQQLMAAMLLAIGLLASALTANQVLAAMAAMISGIALLIVGGIEVEAHWLRDPLRYLAMLDHFATFRRGIVDTRSLTYFLATTVMFLYLAVRAIESRRWKFGVLPGGLATGWLLPRVSIVMLIIAGVLVIEPFASTNFSFVIWTGTNTLLVVLGAILAAIPVCLNRARLRYELSRRRTGLMLTVAANTLLALTIWALVGYFTAQHPLRKDLTSSKHYALSDQTKKVLAGIQAPVEVSLLMGVQNDFHQEVTDLLAEYTAASPHVFFRDIDQLRSPAEVDQLRERFKLPSAPSNEVILSVGDKFRRLPLASLVNQKMIIEAGRRALGPAQFVGEAEITGAVIQLTRASPGRIVFLGGHGERNPDEQGNEGASTIVTQLRRNGWAVGPPYVVTPGANAQFPPDTTIVVVNGPKKALADEDLKALKGVLDRAGGVFVLADPGVKTGLEPLLQEWDVHLSDDIVVDLQEHLATGDPTSLYVTNFKQEDPIGKGMGPLAAVVPTARRAVATYTNPDVNTSNFMLTSGNSWAVAYTPGTRSAPDRNRDKRGPISLGVACERYHRFPDPGKPPLQGRLVVIGDSDFATNHYVDMGGNLNLFLNSIEWLAGRQDLISPHPKLSDVRRLELSASQPKLIFWLSVIAVPGVTMLIGLVAIGRRRYLA